MREEGKREGRREARWGRMGRMGSEEEGREVKRREEEGEG